MMLYINDIDMAVPIYAVKYFVLVAKGGISEKDFRIKVRQWSSASRTVSFLKGLRYGTWPKFEIRVLHWLPSRIGAKPVRQRQADWLAAGDGVMLEKTLDEYRRFRAQGYPKGEGTVDLDDSDIVEVE